MRVCPRCQTRYTGDDPFCSKDGQATIEGSPNVRRDPLIGSSVGNYKITALLGEGGMGAVYRAEHPTIGRNVAIKVLRGEYAYRQDTIERFFNEARSVNQIRHENIVDIIDFGLLPDQRPYFIMELLEGSDLDGHLRKRGAISVTEALDIMMPMLSALQAAHEEGIIHRDLKPENVFLAERKHGGRVVKLLDFGIAKLLDDKERKTTGERSRTNTGSIIGTPAYMSPEQAAGSRDIDHRADVYAAGIILYELLVGAPPFDGETALEIVHKQWKEPPVPPRQKRPDLPEEIEAIILAALEKDREKRIPSAQQFAQRLKAALAKVGASIKLASIKAPAVNRLPSSPGVASVKKDSTPKPPTPNPPAPQTPKFPSGSFSVYKPKLPSSPGVAKTPTPNPGAAYKPQTPAPPKPFGKTGNWGKVDSVKPPSGPSLQQVQKPANAFPKSVPSFSQPIPGDDQATEAGNLEDLQKALQTLRPEETRMVSEVEGGSLKELRRPQPIPEPTRMVSEVMGGSLEALRSAEKKNLDQSTEASLLPDESTQLGKEISGGSLSSLRNEPSQGADGTAVQPLSSITGGQAASLREPNIEISEEFRNESTRMVSEVEGGNLADLQRPSEKKSSSVLLTSEATQSAVALDEPAEKKAASGDAFRNEATRMFNELEGGSLEVLQKPIEKKSELQSLEEFRSESTRMFTGPDDLEKPIEKKSPEAMQEFRSEETRMFTDLAEETQSEEDEATSAGNAPDGLQNFLSGEVDELGDESTQHEAQAPPIDYEAPSEKIDPAPDARPAFAAVPPEQENKETAKELPKPAGDAARPPRHETPQVSGEVASPLKGKHTASQPGPGLVPRLILLGLFLAVLGGAAALLLRQLRGEETPAPPPKTPATTPQPQSAPKEAPKPASTSALPAATQETKTTPAAATKPPEPKAKQPPKPKKEGKEGKETKSDTGLVNPF